MKAKSSTPLIKLTFLLFFISILILGFTYINIDNSSNIASGYTKVSTVVGENGESRVVIPISTPKGTNVQPQLSITYNSQGGNGILGQGFSLNGLYAISRVPATLAQDGFVDGIDFDASDRFALNGERLMVVEGTYGAHQSQYRTEQNSFSKIYSYRTVGGGPKRFTVHTKDGLYMQFGNNANSRIEAEGRSSALIWLVSKITDKKGNYVKITYEEDHRNSEYRPIQIDYTGNAKTGLSPYNSIKFIYESRPDSIASFLSGSRVNLTKRLKRIEAYDHTTLMRSYDIEYLPLSESNKSRVSKITECGQSGICFQPTEFTWGIPQEDLGSEIDESGVWQSHGAGVANNLRNVDFNGDGKTDMASYAGNGNWQVCLSNGSDFDCSFWQGHGGGIGNNIMGDFNGDGKTDIAGYAGGGNWHVSISNGSNFNSSFWQGHGGGVGNNIVADFNGDGLADIAGYAGGGNWHVSISNGSNFSSSFWQGHGGGVGNNIVADFNGDGLADIAADAGGGNWHVSISNGSNFSSSFWQGHGGGVGNNIVADFNGDGLADLAAHTGGLSWHVCLSTGTNFQSVTWQGHGGGTGNNIVGDFNGDGLTDIATHAGGGAWHVCLSNGNGFDSDYWQGHNGGVGNNVVGDFNGDGRTDMAAHLGDVNWGVVLSNSDNEALISSSYGNWHVAPNLIRPMDVNGDGRSDMVMGPSDYGKWYVLKSTDDGFVDEGAWVENAYTGWGTASNRIRPMDVNADGRSDIVLGPSDHGSWYVLKSTGDGFVDEGTWIENAYAAWHVVPNRIRPMDVNGDGLPDIVLGPSDNGTWNVLKNTGASFVDEGSWIDNAYAGWHVAPDLIRPMDVNADGLPDIVLGPSDNGKWHVLRNTGSSFVDEGAWIENAYTGWHVVPNRIRPMDVNADGLPDILLGPADNGIWNVLINTGSSFEKEIDWDYGFEAWYPAPATTYPLDVNGDGLTEIVFGPGSFGHWHKKKVSRITEPSIITTVKNGNGAETEFTYKPLTDESVYEKGDTAAYPRVDFVAPLYVVAKVNSDNGVGGKNVITHKYFEGKYNLHGRGFRGFGKTIKIDSTRGLQSIVYYERDYKCISTKIKRIESRLLDGTLLSEVENAISVKEDFNNKIHFSYISQATEKEYELDGTLVKTKTTNYNYDDFGNPTQIIENYENGFYLVTTNNTYTNDTGNWILGRLTETEVVKQLQGQPSITKKSSFSYDTKGVLIRETLLPDHATLKLQTDYTLDSYGNRIVETQSGPNITSRSDYYTYDSEGRNILTIRNPLGHIVTNNYSSGLLSSTIDPDGLTTSIYRDEFGREVQTVYPDGTEQQSDYLDCQGNCPAGAISYMKTDVSGAGSSWVYLDLLDRNIREQTESFNGSKRYVDYQYNPDGTTHAVSDSYIEGESMYWTTYEYDDAKRVVTETAPGNRITTYQYDGLTKMVTNPEGQNATRIENPLGKLISSIDHQGNSLNYQYDSDLNQTKVIQPGGHESVMSYNLRGFKTSMDDPDMGVYTYQHNTLGLLILQTNPAGQTIHFTYDLLNRPLTRTEPEGVTNWMYDPLHSLGSAHQILVNGELFETDQYNNLGKLIRKVHKRNGEDKEINYTYNDYGQVETIKYPNDFQIKYNYNERGFLSEVRNYSNNELLWKANNYNQYDAVTTFSLGNNLETNRTFDPVTGYLTKIQTGTVSISGSIQDMEFSYSQIGNLIEREDLLIYKTESFQYDVLNRLTQSQVNGQDPQIVDYDVLGNITHKSDVGDYTYRENGKGPHVLTSIDHSTVPDCVYRFDQNVTYTSFNYASTIANSSRETQITYGPNRERTHLSVIKNGQTVLEKTYVGGIYEETVNDLGETTTVCFISAGGEVFAFASKKEDEAEVITYIHTDQLGSVSSHTNENGNVIERYSFDAWGKQRNAHDWTDIQTPPALPKFERGFTFHEMLDVDWLILMNARVYNPVLGRFLSPDPFVQFPEDLQSFNRYAYVLNNPLSLVDPTGHFSLKSIGSFIKENAGTIVGIAIGIAMGNPATIWAAIQSGALAGFGASVTNTVVAGGNLGDVLSSGLQGAVWGGISGGVSYGIGKASIFSESNLSNYKELYVLKATAHGIAQGGIAKTRGGEFRHGFVAGAVGELGMDAADGYFDSFETKVVATAIAGGTATQLSGGKFANGAFSAAFVAIYNHGDKDFGKGEGSYYRYMSGKELDNSLNSGYLRGGVKGENVYFTKDRYRSASKAQNRLSLPVKPEYRVEFQTLTTTNNNINGDKVRPASSRGGGRGGGVPLRGLGSEFMFKNKVPVKFINYQKLNM